MKTLRTLALGLAATGSLATALPVAAAPAAHAPLAATTAIYGDTTWDHGRGHHKRYERGYDRGYDRGYNDYGRSGYNDGYYGEPLRRDTRVWRGDDGRYYCRKSNGTTGLIIGAAGGALVGREVAGRRGDRTLGAILGGAAGALIGREIDRGGSSCR